MKLILLLMLFLPIAASVCRGEDKQSDMKQPAEGNANRSYEKATFAGGCFWCIEAPFEQADGVIDVTSGYTGGHTKNPTYEEVSSGRTGHFEAVQITYDPTRVSYEELLDIFWHQIDPTDDGGQFADRGSQYRTAIFYHSAEQKKISEESKAALNTSGKFNKDTACNHFLPGSGLSSELLQNVPSALQELQERFRSRGLHQENVGRRCGCLDASSLCKTS
jgi:methionine-S-sulfoxide reductase